MPHFRVKVLESGIRSYRIQVKAKDIRTGKWFSKVKTWRQPLDMPNEVAEYEVRKIAYEFENKTKKQARGLLAVDSSISFIEYANKWLDDVKKTKSIAYYLKGVDAINKMTKYFGEIKLCEISPILIQDFLNQVMSDGYIVKRAVLKEDLKKYLLLNNIRIIDIAEKSKIAKTAIFTALDGEKVLTTTAERICDALNIDINKYFDIIEDRREYAKETIVKLKRIMSAILATAKRKRIIENNFATSDYIEPIRGYKKQIKILSIEEVKKLFYYMENNEVSIIWKICIYLALFLGLRRGEIAGLEWKDIDFENKMVSIRRSVVDGGKFGLTTKEPKTENSIRVIAMPDTLIEKLKEYKKVWDFRKCYMGDMWKPSDRLFSNESGDNIQPGLFIHWLKVLLDKADLPQVTLHSLRHSNITMQLVSGVDIKTVSARAGHARASTTSDIYSHYLQQPDYQASQIIDNIFRNKC